MAVTAVVFEGGSATDPMQSRIRSVRQAVALDTLEKLRACPELGGVVLGTDNEELASKASGLGVVCIKTGIEPGNCADPGADAGFGVRVATEMSAGPGTGANMRTRPGADISTGAELSVGARAMSPFHFGRELARVIRQLGLDKVIYLGGATAPLMTPGEVAWIARTLAENDRAVILNNPQSSDLVAFSPASVLQQIDLPRSDNFLGYLLREAGLERILCPNSPSINFDLDTPTDLMILSLQPGTGPRAREQLNRLEWDISPLLAAREALRTDYSEVGLLGRVGGPVISFINANSKCRLRVFSEERGMKALGRDERGEVVSLIGAFVREVGAVKFFQYLAAICGAVFFDTRVIFAHLRGQVSEWDRFHSDLGKFEAITDPFVRDFTREARSCGIPVVLGGHSVVSGGLWLMAESLLADPPS